MPQLLTQGARTSKGRLPCNRSANVGGRSRRTSDSIHLGDVAGLLWPRRRQIDMRELAPNDKELAIAAPLAYRNLYSYAGAVSGRGMGFCGTQPMALAPRYAHTAARNRASCESADHRVAGQLHSLPPEIGPVASKRVYRRGWFSEDSAASEQVRTVCGVPYPCV